MLRSVVLSCATLLAVIAAPGVRAELDLPEDWLAPTEPFELVDGVWWVGTEGLGAYLFESSEGLVLLDVGMPQAAELVLDNIEAAGFDPADVRYLLNTQAHFDHSGGMAAVAEATGATVVASAGDRAALETGTYPGWEMRTALNFPPVAVDREIGHEETLVLGDLTLTAYLTPGHTEGCTTWSFPVAIDGETHRAIVFCSASVALNRLAPDPQYPGIVDDFRLTFERMRALDVDLWFAPHAEQMDLDAKRARAEAVGARAYLDPEEKDRRMAVFEADFEEALTAQRAAAGLDE